MGNKQRVTCCKSYYNAPWHDMGKVTKYLDGFSIPVRVTISLSHNRH